MSRRPRRQTLKSACSRGGCSWRHPLNHNPASLPSPRRRPHHTWSLHAREESRSSTTIMATTSVDLQVCTTPESSSPSSSSSSAARWRRPRRRPHLPRHLHHAGDYLDTALVLPSSTRSRNRRPHQRQTEDKKQVKGARKSHGAPVHLRKCGRELLGLYTISYYDARRHLDARATWFHTQRSGDPIIIDSYFGLLASGTVTPPSSTATSPRPPAERRHPSSSSTTTSASTPGRWHPSSSTTTSARPPAERLHPWCPPSPTSPQEWIAARLRRR